MAWMNTDARERVECPRCKAAPGKQCRTPGGTKTRQPHQERLKALTELPDFEIKAYYVEAKTFDQILEEAMERLYPPQEKKV